MALDMFLAELLSNHSVSTPSNVCIVQDNARCTKHATKTSVQGEKTSKPPARRKPPCRWASCDSTLTKACQSPVNRRCRWAPSRQKSDSCLIAPRRGSLPTLQTKPGPRKPERRRPESRKSLPPRQAPLLRISSEVFSLPKSNIDLGDADQGDKESELDTLLSFYNERIVQRTIESSQQNNRQPNSPCKIPPKLPVRAPCMYGVC